MDTDLRLDDDGVVRLTALASPDAEQMRTNKLAAAKAQRRADLITLTAAAIGGLAASGSGATDAGMQPLVAPACHDPEQFAAIAVRVAEAALDLITERTK